MSNIHSEQSSAIYKLINKLFCFDSQGLYHYKKIRQLIKKLIKEFPKGNIEIDYNININTKRNVKDDLKLFTIKKEDSKTLIYTDLFVYFENETQACLVSRKNTKNAYIKDKINKKTYAYADSSYLLDCDYEDLEHIQLIYTEGDSQHTIALSDDIIITERTIEDIEYKSEEKKYLINHVKIKDYNIESITKKTTENNHFMYDVQFKNTQASSFYFKDNELFDIDINPFVFKIIKKYISKKAFDSFIKDFKNNKISNHEAFKFVTSILIENKDAMFLSYDKKIIDILNMEETLEVCKKHINSNLDKFKFDSYLMKLNIQLLKNHSLFNFNKDFNLNGVPDFINPIETLISLSKTLKKRPA